MLLRQYALGRVRSSILTGRVPAMRTPVVKAVVVRTRAEPPEEEILIDWESFVSDLSVVQEKDPKVPRDVLITFVAVRRLKRWLAEELDELSERWQPQDGNGMRVPSTKQQRYWRFLQSTYPHNQEIMPNCRLWEIISAVAQAWNDLSESEKQAYAVPIVD